MTRILARTAAVAALVTAVAIPAAGSANAASDVAASGRQTVERVAKFADQPSSWASKNGGYIQINWTPPFNVGKYDWVGLYKRDPNAIGLDNYETYQWAYGRGTSYLTSTPAVSGDYWTAYISYDYASGQYRIIESHKTHID
ncbi:hypothetical protein [Streptomyces hiroshimensis]|uniref:Uncharacterized protein n=1 Tax=Streptomyces hiroshimensis TaxID=66424 RepID=A0ABQ2YAW7_9ACTN|nr:hypothetical protein [Streptomyces hiroshimensis]GGX74878.1 hypothetical protein GCM10010324_20300 [Streptomyces hiroshimensis]